MGRVLPFITLTLTLTLSYAGVGLKRILMLREKMSSAFRMHLTLQDHNLSTIYGTGALGYFAEVMTHWIRGLGARKRHLRRVARKNSVIGSVLSLGNAFQDYEYDSDEHELPPNSGATNVEETFLTLFR